MRLIRRPGLWGSGGLSSRSRSFSFSKGLSCVPLPSVLLRGRRRGPPLCQFSEGPIPPGTVPAALPPSLAARLRTPPSTTKVWRRKRLTVQELVPEWFASTGLCFYWPLLPSLLVGAALVFHFPFSLRVRLMRFPCV